MTDHLVSADLLFATTHYTKSWVHSAVLRSFSLLQDASNVFPMTQGNYQHTPSSSQQFQHPPVNCVMPFPPEPIPAKIVKSMMPPPVPSSQTTTSPGHPATLPVQPQKAWLTPPDNWKPGDGARPWQLTSAMDSCLHTGHVAACGRIHLRPSSGPRVHISRMAQSLPL